MGPSSLPLWIDDPQWRGFATLGTARARAAGLHVRPLRDTLRDALAFEEVRDVPRAAGLTDDEERRVQEAVAALTRGAGRVVPRAVRRQDRVGTVGRRAP